MKINQMLAQDLGISSLTTYPNPYLYHIIINIRSFLLTQYYKTLIENSRFTRIQEYKPLEFAAPVWRSTRSAFNILQLHLNKCRA